MHPNMFYGFSCPQESMTPHLVDDIAKGHGEALWIQLTVHHGSELEDASRGLLGHVGPWLAEHGSFETVWHRSFGLAHRDAQGVDDPKVIAAAIGLRLTAHGMGGHWRISLDAPAVFPFHRFRLPAAQALEVRAEGNRVRLLLTRDGRTEEFHGVRQDLHSPSPTWTLSRPSGEPCETLPGFDLGGRFCQVVFADDGHVGAVPVHASRRDVVSVEEVAQATRQALNLLQSHAPEYADWVLRVLRGIAPIRVQDGRMRSGSEFGWPGVIAMSFPAHPAGLAEMLVHECSHQYYHQVRHLGGVDDGTDTTLYHSPVKGTGRPIRKILLAYHAFANVLLMNRRFLDAGQTDYCAGNERMMTPQVGQLEASLRRTTSLTNTGRALFEPLRDRMAALY